MITRKSKRESLFKFSEALQHKSQSDTPKLLRNARGRHLGLRKASSLSAEDEDPNKYTEYFDNMYKSHRAEMHRSNMWR